MKTCFVPNPPTHQLLSHHQLRRRRLSSAMATAADGNITSNACFGCPIPCITGDPDCTLVVVDISSPPPLTFTTHIKSHLVLNLIIAAAALLAASFLLLLATYAVHRLRRRRRRLLSVTPSAPDHAEGVAADVEAVDHHVWHIRTAGLDDATIRSIATAVYSSKGAAAAAADCAVCLVDLRDGELLRLLPKCSHAFHLPCIDTWLRSHLNCPLCRSPVLPPPAAAAAPPPAIAPDSDNSASPPPSETAPIDVAPPAVASSSSPVEDGLLQPVRRSVSMDAASLAGLLLRAVPEDNYCGEERELVKNWENQSSTAAAAAAAAAAKGAALQKGAQRMGRSLSSRSGRFFLSRYARGRNSILPL